jgi:hypothetical protein
MNIPEKTLLPAKFLEKWRGRARAGNAALLENVIEFVDEFYDELNYGDKAQAYSESAAANFCSEYTFRDRVSKVVRFRECDLVEWFMNGIGWDHLENAPSLRPDDPASLITDCLKVGNADGETMTVSEMINFELEGENRQAASASFHFDREFGKLCKLPILLKWDKEKTGRYNKWLDAGREFFK